MKSAEILKVWCVRHGTHGGEFYNSPFAYLSSFDRWRLFLVLRSYGIWAEKMNPNKTSNVINQVIISIF